MNDTALRLEGLFDDGPFPHFQKSIGLFRPVGLNVLPRAVSTVLLGWFPLVILVLVQSSIDHGVQLQSFLTDFGVHARSLIAVPLFILSERVCLPRLNEVAHHFVGSGLVADEDHIKFHNLVMATRARMNSTLAEVLAFMLAYAIIWVFIRYQLPGSIPPRYWVQRETNTFSWAGWWYVLISLPLLLIVVFGWLWRVLLWTRFLLVVSRMNLRYIAAHPDHAAGLKFLNASLLAFTPVAFTFGIIVAGSLANKVRLSQTSVDNVQNTLGALLGVVLVLFAGPLLIFSLKLYMVKIKGVFGYGQLANFVGRSFEEKWLTGYKKTGQHSLEVPDFSATTDLYSIVANVHSATVIPFEWRALLGLAIATLIPFLPVVLMAIPLKVIIKELANLLL
jgi:hypothetical protein